MKTIAKIFMAAIASMAMASCVQDKAPVVKTYRAVCDLDMTKASLAEDGHSVNWADDDKITIWYKSGETYVSTVASVVENNGKSAVFEYTIADQAADLTTLYAVYGQSESESVIVGKTDLQAVKNGFDPKGLVMCAKYEGDGVNHSFAFRNFSSLLKVEINNTCKNATIAKMVLTAEPSGKYTNFAAKSTWAIDSEGTCSIDLLDPATDGITINGTFESGVYYIPVLAVDGSVYPITATLYDTEGNSKAFTNRYSVKPDRNTILPFGKFEPMDSWFITAGSEKVLFESAFDGETKTTYAYAGGTFTIDGKTWDITIGDWSQYYAWDSTSHILLSNRKSTNPSVAESGNLLSAQGTVTAFSVSVSERNDVESLCVVEYSTDGGNTWEEAGRFDPVKSTSSVRVKQYEYSLVPAVTTEDFRIRVSHSYDPAPTAWQYMYFEGVKVMGK